MGVSTRSSYELIASLCTLNSFRKRKINRIIVSVKLEKAQHFELSAEMLPVFVIIVNY